MCGDGSSSYRNNCRNTSATIDISLMSMLSDGPAVSLYMSFVWVSNGVADDCCFGVNAATYAKEDGDRGGAEGEAEDVGGACLVVDEDADDQSENDSEDGEYGVFSGEECLCALLDGCADFLHVCSPRVFVFDGIREVKDEKECGKCCENDKRHHVQLDGVKRLYAKIVV